MRPSIRREDKGKAGQGKGIEKGESSLKRMQIATKIGDRAKMRAKEEAEKLRTLYAQTTQSQKARFSLADWIHPRFPVNADPEPAHVPEPEKRFAGRCQQDARKVLLSGHREDVVERKRLLVGRWTDDRRRRFSLVQYATALDDFQLTWPSTCAFLPPASASCPCSPLPPQVFRDSEHIRMLEPRSAPVCVTASAADDALIQRGVDETAHRKSNAPTSGTLPHNQLRRGRGRGDQSPVFGVLLSRVTADSLHALLPRLPQQACAKYKLALSRLRNHPQSRNGRPPRLAVLLCPSGRRPRRAAPQGHGVAAGEGAHHDQTPPAAQSEAGKVEALSEGYGERDDRARDVVGPALLAKEAQTSMSHYAAGARARLRKSKLGPTSFLALAEIVNLPQKFRTSTPYCQGHRVDYVIIEPPAADASAKAKKKNVIPFVKLDPAQTITLMNKALRVPQLGYRIGELVQQRRNELMEEEYDETEREGQEQELVVRRSGGVGLEGQAAAHLRARRRKMRYSSPSATMAVQRELKTMMMGDNLFQWIVEMYSFDETLPIAKDLKREFPPTYPIGSPSFRVITPLHLKRRRPRHRRIFDVLMQIKLAISSLDPRPARLDDNRTTPYSVDESLPGFKRAAATHGWTPKPKPLEGAWLGLAWAQAPACHQKFSTVLMG
ncbi:hypothetical protein C8R45DRAFT_1175857 [Mycena sanguinolenta]|nr:hypothetical protein C8R45DRAFT_1175857 [Mycena sanguinolenta]